MKEEKICVSEGSKVGEIELTHERTALPSCIDKLREELSCAICLEICFEPSTTPCGHSFCKKCLQRATFRCDQNCPKCRQLISFSPSPIVNTVMWNTIQLLFSQEVEARKTALKNEKIASSSSRRLAPLPRLAPIRRHSPVNVEPSEESMSEFAATNARFSPGDVIEMRLEVMEKNNEEMALVMKELKLVEPANQRPPSILFTLFWKIVNSTKIFCM